MAGGNGPHRLQSAERHSSPAAASLQYQTKGPASTQWAKYLVFAAGRAVLSDTCVPPLTEVNHPANR